MPNKDNYNHQDVYAPRKRGHSKLRFFLKLAGFVFLSSILIGGLYAVFYSPFFKVQSLKTSETKLITSANLIANLSIQTIANNRLAAMLGPDNVLFWFLTPRSLAVKNLPALAAFNIQTNLLKREVMVNSEERVLFGVWCLKDNKCYGFDKEGIIFTEAPQVQGVLILKIDDVNQKPIVLGQSIFNKPAWLTNIFTTLEILNNNGFAVASLEMRELSLEEWQVKLALGPSFYFSLNFVPDDLDSILKNLVKRLNFNQLNYLDFRVKNRVYYK